MPATSARPRGGDGGARPDGRRERELETLEALKGRVDIVEIVGRYATLKRRGAELWACCPLHAEKSPSFKVDPAWQTFRCFGCGIHGDVFDFIAAAERLSLADAIRKVREMAGGTAAPDLTLQAERRAAAVAEEARSTARRRQKALAIWRASVPLRGDASPDAVRYLRHRRGLSSWDAFKLRWHSNCPWGLGTAPCLVAGVHDLEGAVTAIWRIKIAMEGKVERWGLAPVDGHAARLFEPEPELPLVVTEGVEDALAARELSTFPAWAALSKGNMAALVLPPSVREVLILADADAGGREAAHTLARRLQAEGREATVMRPGAGFGKDPNDALRATGCGS